MAKIIAPNKKYNGVSASVSFRNGEGYTDNPHLINWFKEHGYQVEESKEKAEPKKRAKSKKETEQDNEDSSEETTEPEVKE